MRFSLSQILFYLLSFCIGGVFLFSAYSKVIDILPFEWTIAESGLFSFNTSNILARLFIIIEIALGLCFIFQVHAKQKVYKAAAILLFLFNIYLLYILFTYGNNGNCGCFGNMLAMTPLQAYFKNLVLLLLIYILSLQKVKFTKWQKWLPLGFLIASGIGVLAYTPAEFMYIDEPEKLTKVSMDPLNKLNTKLPVNQSKYVLGVLSTSCGFCKTAAKKLKIIHKIDPTIPMVNMFVGDSVSMNNFIKETQCGQIPYILSDPISVAQEIAENTYPSIFLVENGLAIKKTNYFELEADEIKNWLNK